MIYITEIGYLRKFSKPKKSIKLNSKNLRKYNIIILATDHDSINYNFLKKNSSMIFDCRGRYSYSKHHNIIQL